MRLAVMQCEPVSNADEALARLTDAARQAADAGASILVTPEMFLTGYNIGAAAVGAAAEPLGGPMTAGVCEVAAAHGIAIIAGLPLLVSGAVHNSALFVDRAGKQSLHYHKSHLYGDVDRAQFSAGHALSGIVSVGPWRIALAICYDIEFPELARCLALQGADMLLVPTANMDPYDSVATRIVPARAEENGLVIAYANYCGSEGRFTYCGQSCVIGPTGEDLARAGRDAALILADIDHGAIATARADVPYLNDRRTDLYEPMS